MKNIVENRHFCDNLKAERKNAGISQKDFARLVGTTQQRVSEWECGKVEPSLYSIISIIRVLDITFEELTYGIVADPGKNGDA